MRLPVRLAGPILALLTLATIPAAAAASTIPTTPLGFPLASAKVGGTSTGSRVTSVSFNIPFLFPGDQLVGFFADYDSTGEVHVSDNVNGAWTRSPSTPFGQPVDQFTFGPCRACRSLGDVGLFYTTDQSWAGGVTVTISSDQPTYLLGTASAFSGVAPGGPTAVSITRGNSSGAFGSGPITAAAGELVYGARITASPPGSSGRGISGGLFVQHWTTPQVAPLTLTGETVGADAVVTTVAGVQQATYWSVVKTNWHAIAAAFPLA